MFRVFATILRMKSKSIKLIAFDRNQNLQYEGKCKLRINRISSMFSVEPEDEEYKMISALFKWNFFMDKNFLFVFGEHATNDFALMFDEQIRCKKVYDFVCKNKIQKGIEKDIIYRRFWIPLCKRFAHNLTANEELIRIFKEWIDERNKEEKEKCYKLLKENNVIDIIFSSYITTSSRKKVNENEDQEDGTTDFDNLRCVNYRKRRHVSCDQNNRGQPNDNSEIDRQKQMVAKNFVTAVDAKSFKLVNCKTEFRTLRRLLIFTSTHNTHCHEFAWSYIKKIYYCTGCKESQTKFYAILDKCSVDGIEIVKLEDKKHACTAIPYIPEKYIEMKIYKSSDYEILENCTSASGRIVVIYSESDKSRCWEFRTSQRQNEARCRQCNTLAKIWNEKEEDEHVELMNANHRCQTVVHDPKKYYQFNDFILSPNFEVHNYFDKNGKQKQKLIIFDKSDRNLCYTYTVINTLFQCNGCHLKGLRNTAKIVKNSDGEDYVLLSSVKHVCEILSYTEATKKEIVLRSPDFKLIENIETGRSTLLVFEPNDRSLYYKFSHTLKNRYVCLGCTYILKKNSCGKIVSGNLLKDRNGENVVLLNDSTHVCTPRKLEKKTEFPKFYDYFFFRRKRFPDCINMALYHPEDKNLCFIFLYVKKHSVFRCEKCHAKNKHVIIKMEKDVNGKEYFSHDFKKHVCEKPTKISSIKDSKKFVILDRSNLDLTKKVLPKMFEKKDYKIVKAPNFILQPNKKSIPDAALFIFKNEERNLGYRYWYSSNTKNFLCSRYKHDHCCAKAKIHIDDNKEKCIALNSNEHKCTPVEYEDKEKIIKASNFKVLQQDNGKAKIFVFTSPAHDECYEFVTEKKSKNTFHCLGCRTSKKYVYAKLGKDENDQDILKMLKNSHVCIPRKYIKEKYEPKIISSEMIELHPNVKGIEDKRLVIFTTEKKNFMHEYYWHHANAYICLRCRSKKLQVLARVIENQNGQKYVESGANKHICKPQKYDSKKYAQSKIILRDSFLFLPGPNGEKEKYLAIFTTETKESAYKLCLARAGFYQCNPCSNKKQYNVSAKVIEDANGIKSLQLGKKEHVCKPQKFDLKMLKFC